MLVILWPSPALRCNYVAIACPVDPARHEDHRQCHQAHQVQQIPPPHPIAEHALLPAGKCCYMNILLVSELPQLPNIFCAASWQSCTSKNRCIFEKVAVAAGWQFFASTHDAANCHRSARSVELHRSPRRLTCWHMAHMARIPNWNHGNDGKLFWDVNHDLTELMADTVASAVSRFSVNF